MLCCVGLHFITCSETILGLSSICNIIMWPWGPSSCGPCATLVCAALRYDGPHLALRDCMLAEQCSERKHAKEFFIDGGASARRCGCSFDCNSACTMDVGGDAVPAPALSAKVCWGRDVFQLRLPTFVFNHLLKEKCIAFFFSFFLSLCPFLLFVSLHTDSHLKAESIIILRRRLDGSHHSRGKAGHDAGVVAAAKGFHRLCHWLSHSWVGKGRRRIYPVASWSRKGL